MAEKAPSVDQDGKMINPHNPDFITKVPWYLGNNSGPTLKHHSIQKVDHVLSLSESDELINKKIAAQKEAAVTSNRTVFKKGACKNCGATTHKEKDCVERPRSAKKAAWKSGLDIAPDEVSLKLENFGKVSYDAKRDQYKGYNPEEYQEVVEKHSRLEAERKKLSAEANERRRKEEEEEKLKRKAEKKAKAAAKAAAKVANAAAAPSAPSSGDGAVAPVDADEEKDADFSDSDSDSDYGSDAEEDGEDGDDDAKARDEQARDFQNTMAPQGGLGGAGMRVTVRNLRLREDTPKYLRNLDLGSAFYDPKSRSMRLNPHPDMNPEDLAFAGDNFVRHTGDAVKLAQNLVLCWEMQARGESIDVISNPSQAELVQKQFVEKKKDLEENKRRAILEKYLDGKEMPKELDPRLRLGQTEAYVEYSRDGRIIKGAGASAGGKAVAMTKYEEDVFTNNHTSVWGSYFCRTRSAWGYACCHSVMKNSYCTGEVGKEANSAAGLDTYQARKMLESTKKLNAAGGNSGSSSSSSVAGVVKKSDLYGEASTSAVYDKQKLEEAQRRAEAANNDSSSSSSSSSSNGAAGTKRALYNSMQNADVTAEDMEVYRMKRLKSNDPMAAFNADSEELLEYDSSKR